MSLLNYKLLEDTSKFKSLLDNYTKISDLKAKLKADISIVKEFNIQITPLPVGNYYFSNLPVTSILCDKGYIDVLDKILEHLKSELIALKEKIKRDYGSIKLDIEEEFNKLKIK